MEQAQEKKHTCPTASHCCECDGCGSSCKKTTTSHCWIKYLLIALGILAVFYVGMRVGEVNGRIKTMEGEMSARCRAMM